MASGVFIGLLVILASIKGWVWQTAIVLGLQTMWSELCSSLQQGAAKRQET
jgi:hypothetical protein